MITIPLSKTGKNAGKYEAMVDDIDADLAELNWNCQVSVHYVYAKRGANSLHDFTLLHRVILSRKLGRPLSKGEQVDHINNNGMDNRRSNLRVATQSQIRMNSRKSKSNKLGLKGVTRDKDKYRAVIERNKKQIFLGLFDTPEQAHTAYCRAAKKYHGEFANNG